MSLAVCGSAGWPRCVLANALGVKEGSAARSGGAARLREEQSQRQEP
jgi:hypothetical protein